MNTLIYERLEHVPIKTWTCFPSKGSFLCRSRYDLPRSGIGVFQNCESRISILNHTLLRSALSPIYLMFRTCCRRDSQKLNLRNVNAMISDSWTPQDMIQSSSAGAYIERRAHLFLPFSFLLQPPVSCSRYHYPQSLSRRSSVTKL